MKIRISGRVGYLKLTYTSLIFPVTDGSVMPSVLLESILGLLSRISSIEAAESLALLLSGAKALLWETPTADIVKAKKTCRNSHWLELEGKQPYMEMREKNQTVP